ncbi:hypothetical protein HMPREF9318_00555 [Streptococcus urinalis FB127-CNA-2]|uniref:ABC transporter, ATP-binding protein n=1 Tax=Streptococcus urinalis 2285-97 TaxID=764291 RepID=G5KGI9_9STRE|nr:hypothetical protein [Streptococcus urinalis]EHJ56795.1 ABC transporter, ATP-binding protein [Streptococcus urinalis 2285-97]EKS22357.1 hypothetical protein HMPREF9318_00555 [Streptococcus urinalis FB127-CNA-2]VEF32170.1 membrane protein [Streptococcus urinalis]
MFRKLMKYEFKSIGKWYFGLNIAVLTLSVILGLTINSIIQFVDSESDIGDALTSRALPLALILTLAVLVAGSWISTLFIIINRFHRNIFQREGYLTLTLPVSTHQILFSKLFASVILNVINLIVLILGVEFLLIPILGFQDATSSLSHFFFDMKFLSEDATILFYLFLASITNILLIYLSITIGQQFERRKGLIGFFAYFCISLLLIFTGDIFLPTNNITGIGFYVYYIVEFCTESLILYLITHYLIKYKTNLN